MIFNLRPEAKFSDGTPMTAEDVVFTFNVLLDKGEPSYKISLKDIEKVEVLDPHRVKFTFKPGSPTRDLPAMAGGLSILPKHYYDNASNFEESTMVPPVGSGAYVRGHRPMPGRQIVYCRNPDYWGQGPAGQRGADEFRLHPFRIFRRLHRGVRGVQGGRLHFPPGVLVADLGHGL